MRNCETKRTRWGEKEREIDRLTDRDKERECMCEIKRTKEEE